MRNAIPVPDKIILTELLRKAQQNCFAVGLTGVSDAGLEFDQVQIYRFPAKKRNPENACLWNACTIRKKY